jgi:hypothetical protein
MTKWLPPGKGGYTAKASASKSTSSTARSAQKGRHVTKATARRLPPKSSGGATRAK